MKAHSSQTLFLGLMCTKLPSLKVCKAQVGTRCSWLDDTNNLTVAVLLVMDCGQSVVNSFSLIYVEEQVILQYTKWQISFFLGGGGELS